MGKLRSVGRYVIEERTLGKGNFAVVELATHSITKTKVAIKVIDRDKIKEEYVRANLYREARILAQLRHPNVVRLYETISSSSLYCLVTEFAAGGDLLSFVRGQRDGRLGEVSARRFVRQLVSALHHMHDRGVVHRDLKMENIMLDEKKKNLKIVDFGLSNTFSPDNLLKTHCGSPEYAAPELFISTQDYGPEVDLWSLGINMFAMVTGRLPFSTPYTENRRQRLLQQIQNGLGVIHGKEMAHLSEECQELLSQLIEPSPELRLPLLDVEVHPWITDSGETAFYPYQQPPKDMDTRRMIMEKTAHLLKVNLAKIEGSVHEYRLDEVSAIYNLMLDQYLVNKGYRDTDHTIRKEVKRPKTIEVMVRPKTPPATPAENTVEDMESVELRTPTIIGMVRPSQHNHERPTCLSADFELSAVSYATKSKQRRAKTATFPGAGVKTRPFGNATTANSVIARNHNFGPPSTTPTQTPRVFSSPPARKTSAAHVPKMHTRSKSVQSGDRLKDTSECNQSQSKGDGPMTDAVMSQQRKKKPIKKMPVARATEFLQSKESGISGIKTNAESAHDVKVVDMAKYFTFKHGYIVKETSLSTCKPQEISTKDDANPVNVHTSHRDQLLTETESQHDVHSCVSSRVGSPTKTSTQRSELARERMKLTTSPVNALFRPHHADPALQKSLLLTKRALQTRFSQAGKAGTKPRSKSSPQRSTSSQSRANPRSNQCVFSVSRSACDSPRARLPTPVAFLQSSEDTHRAYEDTKRANEDTQRANEIKAWKELLATKDSSRRRGMPPRLEWKRSGVGKGSCWVDERDDIRTNLEDEREVNAKKLQEMMSRDSIHQKLSTGNIRVNSAKIVAPPKDEQSLQRKSLLAGSNHGRAPGKTQPYRGHYKMEKYGHKRSQTYPRSNQEGVINLGEQHMMSLLQEASKKFEDSVKKEEKRNNLQSIKKGKHHNDIMVKSSQSLTSNQQPNIHSQGPTVDEQQNTSSLRISTKPPPILPSNVTPQQVFNVQKSREFLPVTSPMTGKLGGQRSYGRKYRGKDWDAGYRLERKVSDTIKRAGSAIRRTPDLLQNCT
ncbi:uncharacterized protein [Asterias amurensis]|uniref:uncharacterized protein isoform X1 n=1 Tax=Asterias amurensis TaxID=7602 RepID=UPI003AB5F134